MYFLEILVIIVCLKEVVTVPYFVKPSGKNDICKEKVCEFTLTIREEMTMTRKYRQGKIFETGETMVLKMEDDKLLQTRGYWYQQPLYEKEQDVEITNVTDDVITADGVTRSIITVNEQFPGPTLEVMEGAEIVVRVHNRMLDKAASIHWHGFHQRGTQWMDGTSFITQCPIPPHSSFTYRFMASPAGTHWYHAHLAGLRADGLFGFFIVHRAVPEEHHYSLLINHWNHLPFNEFMTINPFRPRYDGAIAGTGQLMYSKHHWYTGETWRSDDGTKLSSMMYTSALINGRGRYGDVKTPLSWFNVTQYTHTGFYLMNPGVEYSFEMSIDQHRMEIVRLDRTEVEPKIVDSIVLNPGERVRVRIYAGNPIDNYWIRASTLNNNKHVFGVLHYKEAGVEEPMSTPTECSRRNKCTTHNCPNPEDGDGISKECVYAYQYKTMERKPQRVVELLSKVDHELFLDFGFPIGSSINGHRFVMPKNHMYSPDPRIKKCKKKKCNTKAGCYCTFMNDLPYNKTVQLVLTNMAYNKLGYGHHTLHLHGYDFTVLKTAFAKVDRNTSTILETSKDVNCPGKFCRGASWVDYDAVSKTFVDVATAPEQDSVLLPYGGYTVVRFRTDNPGSWFMHCHQMMHAIEGMETIFRVAPEMVQKPPANFAQYCGDFDISRDEFQKYLGEYKHHEMN